MPITNTRRSQSPIDLTHTNLDHDKNGPTFGLYPHNGHRLSTSTSSISSATSTSSSIISDTPRYTPQPKAPFNNIEAWTLYDFECHARCCPTCQDTYHNYNHNAVTTSSVCHSGHVLAEKVVNLVYTKAAGYNNGTMRYPIPEGHVYVRELLLAVESRVRRRRLLAESRATRQRYASFDGTYDVRARSVADPLPRLELEQERPPTRGRPRGDIETPAETLKSRATSSVAPVEISREAISCSTPTTAAATLLHSTRCTTHHSSRDTTAAAKPPASNHATHKVEPQRTRASAPVNAAKTERGYDQENTTTRTRSTSKSKSKTTQPRRIVRFSWFLT